MRRHRLCTALLTVAMLMLAAARARAEDRLGTLERELDLFAEQGRRERIGNAVVLTVLGGTLLPAGIAMTKRREETVHLIGIGTIVTAAVQLARLPELIFPSDMERMRTGHRQRKAQGLAGDALVTSTEREWQKNAATEHRVQRWIGAVSMAIGIVALPVGISFVLRDEIGDLGRRKQLNIGATMLGLAAGNMTSGALLLFSDGPTERSWRSHSVALGMGPVASGWVLHAGARF